MSATTMALGSQPASMPAESNLDQMTHLISPARSELSEIDPSWEILALAAEPGSTLACNGASRDAPLCASPHTPVWVWDCRQFRRLSSVRMLWRLRSGRRSARRSTSSARKHGRRSEWQRSWWQRAMRAARCAAHAEREGCGALAAIRDALAVAHVIRG